jgi:hypothetical protein
MKFIATISSLVALTAAAPDPLITPRAEVAARQDTNPAALGYVSASTCKWSHLYMFPTALCHLLDSTHYKST